MRPSLFQLQQDEPGSKPAGNAARTGCVHSPQRSTRAMRQSVQRQIPEVQTELVDIPGTELRVSRVGLGTWAMGGWMWGGTDRRESVATIRAALEQGINLIDTAPVYGFGVSEEIVGEA